MHGWETPGARESDCFDSVPMSVDSASSLLDKCSPIEAMPEHTDLEKEVGFSYQQVLDEVVYA